MKTYASTSLLTSLMSTKEFFHALANAFFHARLVYSRQVILLISYCPVKSRACLLAPQKGRMLSCFHKRVRRTHRSYKR
jgi:hypothetical protein